MVVSLLTKANAPSGPTFRWCDAAEWRSSCIRIWHGNRTPRQRWPQNRRDHPVWSQPQPSGSL